MSPHKCGKHNKKCCDDHSEKKKSSSTKKPSSSNDRFEHAYIIDPGYQNGTGAGVRVGTHQLTSNQLLPSPEFPSGAYIGRNNVPLVNASGQLGYCLGSFPLNVVPVSGGFVLPPNNTKTIAQHAQMNGLNPQEGVSMHPSPINVQRNGHGIQAFGIPVCFLASTSKYNQENSGIVNVEEMERRKHNENGHSGAIGCSYSKKHKHDRLFKQKARQRKTRTSSRQNKMFRIPHFICDNYYYDRPLTRESNFSSDSETCSVSSEGSRSNYYEDDYPFERRAEEIYQMRRINRHSTPTRYVFRRHSKDDEGEYVVRNAAKPLPINNQRNVVTELPVRDEPTKTKTERLESGDPGDLPKIRTELHQHNVETQKRIYDLEKKIDELKVCLCPSNEPASFVHSSVRNPTAINPSVINPSVTNQSTLNNSSLINQSSLDNDKHSTVGSSSALNSSERNPTLLHPSILNTEKLIQTEPHSLNVEHIALIPVDQFKPCCCPDQAELYDSSDEILDTKRSTERIRNDTRITRRTQNEGSRSTRVPEEGETSYSEINPGDSSRKTKEDNRRNTRRTQKESRRETRTPDDSLRETRIYKEDRRDIRLTKGEPSESHRTNERREKRRAQNNKRDTRRAHIICRDMSVPEDQDARYIQKSKRDMSVPEDEDSGDTQSIQESGIRAGRVIQEGLKNSRGTSPGSNLSQRKVCCVNTKLEECTDFIECPMNRCKCGFQSTPEIVYESEEESSTSIYYAYTDRTTLPILNSGSFHLDNDKTEKYKQCNTDKVYFPNNRHIKEFIYAEKKNCTSHEGICSYSQYMCDNCWHIYNYSLSLIHNTNSSTFAEKKCTSTAHYLMRSFYHIIQSIISVFNENIRRCFNVRSFSKGSFFGLMKVTKEWMEQMLIANTRCSDHSNEQYSKITHKLRHYFKDNYYHQFIYHYNPLQKIVNKNIWVTENQVSNLLNSMSKVELNKINDQFTLSNHEHSINIGNLLKFCTWKSAKLSNICFIPTSKFKNEYPEKSSINSYENSINRSWLISTWRQEDYCRTYSCLPVIQDRIGFENTNPFNTLQSTHYINSKIQCEQWIQPKQTADVAVSTERFNTTSFDKPSKIYNTESRYAGNTVHDNKSSLDKVVPNAQRVEVLTQSVPLLNTFILTVPKTSSVNVSSQTDHNYSNFSHNSLSAETYPFTANRLSNSSSCTGSLNENDFSYTYNAFSNYQNETQLGSHTQTCKECGRPLNSLSPAGCKCPYIRECLCSPNFACNCPTNAYHAGSQPYPYSRRTYPTRKATGVQVAQNVKPQSTQYSDVQLTHGRQWRDVETQCFDCEKSMIIETRENDKVKRWICKPLSEVDKESDFSSSSHQASPGSGLYKPISRELQHQPLPDGVQYQPASNITDVSQHYSDQASAESFPSPQYNSTPKIEKPPLGSSQYQPDRGSVQSLPTPQHQSASHIASRQERHSPPLHAVQNIWPPPYHSKGLLNPTSLTDVALGKNVHIQTDSSHNFPLQNLEKPEFLYCNLCGKSHHLGNIETQFQIVCKKCVCKLSSGKQNESNTSLSHHRPYTCTEDTLDPVLRYNYIWQCDDCKHWNKQENTVDNNFQYRNKLLSSQIKLKCECATEDSFSEPRVQTVNEEESLSRLQSLNEDRSAPRINAVLEDKNIETESSIKLMPKQISIEKGVMVSNEDGDFLWQCRTCKKWNSTNPNKYKDHHEWQCKKCQLSIVHPDFEGKSSENISGLRLENKNNEVMKCNECYECNGYWMCKTCKEIASYDKLRNAAQDEDMTNLRMERISTLSEGIAQTSTTTLNQRRPSRTVFVKDRKRKSPVSTEQQDSVKGSMGFKDTRSLIKSPKRQRSSAHLQSKTPEDITVNRIGSSKSKISSGYINGHEVILVEEPLQDRPLMASGSSNSSNVFSPRSIKMPDESSKGIKKSASSRSRITGYIDGKKIILADDKEDNANLVHSTLEKRTTRKSSSPKMPPRTSTSFDYPASQSDNQIQEKQPRQAIPRTVFRTKRQSEPFVHDSRMVRTSRSSSVVRRRSEPPLQNVSLVRSTSTSPKRIQFPNTTFVKKSPKNTKHFNDEETMCDNRICRCSHSTDLKEGTSGEVCPLIENKMCNCHRLELYRCEEHKHFHIGKLQTNEFYLARGHHTSPLEGNDNFVVYSTNSNTKELFSNSKSKHAFDHDNAVRGSETICHCGDVSKLKPCIRKKRPTSRESANKHNDPCIETQRDSTVHKQTKPEPANVVNNFSDDISSTETMVQTVEIKNVEPSFHTERHKHSSIISELTKLHKYSESNSGTLNERQPKIKKKIYLRAKTNRLFNKQEYEAKKVDTLKETCVRNENKAKKKANLLSVKHKDKLNNLLFPEIMNKIHQANGKSGNTNAEYSIKKVKLHNQKKIYVLVKRRKPSATEHN